MSRSGTPRPNPKVSRDFVAWWLTDAMDCSNAADSSRLRSAGWVNHSDTLDSFKTQFWDARDNYRKKRLMYQLADCWVIDANADGLVKVRTFGVVISDAEKYIFKFLTLDFLVDRNEDGYRVAEFQFPEAQNNAAMLTKFIANASEANVSDRYIAQSPSETKSRRDYVRSIVWFARGHLRDRLNNYHGALNSYNEAIKANPTDCEAYIERSWVKQKLGDKFGALEDSKIATIIAPRVAWAHSTYATNLFCSKLLRAAELEYSEYVRLEPTAARGYFYRGRVRCALGKTAAAFADLKTAIRLAPSNADIYMYRGQLEERCGHKATAMKDFQRAHQLNPKIEKWPALDVLLRNKRRIKQVTDETSP